ncbi:MAG: hypothetical protein K5839_01915 [Treponemataceae bacterium]|nr:hypothetical protein [Treponemataceae bacterium]
MAEEKALIIFGLKHSGKTTLGNYLAGILNVPFIDMDDVMAEMTGMTVRKYYEEKGEEEFRKAEYQAAKSVFEKNKGIFVLATGGGICDNPEAMAILDGKKIFIDAKEETCYFRILQKAKETGSLPAYISERQPKNAAEIKEIFHEFYVRRRESYLSIAEEIVDLS